MKVERVSSRICQEEGPRLVVSMGVSVSVSVRRLHALDVALADDAEVARDTDREGAQLHVLGV